MQLFSAHTAICLNFFAPKKIKKNLQSKLAHNCLGYRVFSPARYCFVQLRQCSSLTFSHL